MKLNSVAKKFVVHWGEMSPFWGINKPVGQIFGLLFVSAEPLSVDDLTKTLRLGKAQARIALKELQSWGIIQSVRDSSDGVERFVALSDVWDAFGKILQERKKREIDPSLKLLRDCVSKGSSKSVSSDEATARQRISGMLEFFELTSSLAGRAAALGPKSLKRLAQTGNTIFQVAGLG